MSQTSSSVNPDSGSSSSGRAERLVGTGVSASVADDGSKPSKGPKGMRRRHPKATTGCSTCRTRRLKCDEERPECHRCVKSGWKCDGFPPQYVPLDTKGSRKLLPKGFPKPQLAEIQIRTGPKFSDNKQGRYFRFYCEDIAAQIAGPFATTLWERIVPQSGEVEPSIGHCIAALGALTKSRTIAWNQQPLPADWLRTGFQDPHYQYALVQY